MKNEYADIKLPVAFQLKDGSISTGDDGLPFYNTRESLTDKDCGISCLSSVEMDATPEELAELSDSELVQKWADLINQNPLPYYVKNESRSFARFVSYEKALPLCEFDFERYLNCLEQYQYYWDEYGDPNGKSTQNYWDEYGTQRRFETNSWNDVGEYVVKFLKLVDPKLLEGKIPSREEVQKTKEAEEAEEARRKEIEAKSPTGRLRAAIRQRDAKAEAERIAAEKIAEAERLAAEKKERELQENHKKLTDFLYEIGDFVVPRDWSSKVIGDMWTVRDGSRIILINLDGGEIVLFPADGFEKNSQRIIQWAVDLGAKEPEPAIL